MIPDQLNQLIQLLTHKTKNKKAIWNKVSGNNQFKLSISEGVSITINEWSDNYNGDGYEVVIFNVSGDAIQRYSTDSNTPTDDYELLKEFHKAASDQFFKVEETLAALLKSVTGLEIIGKLDTPANEAPAEEDSEDDLPF